MFKFAQPTYAHVVCLFNLTLSSSAFEKGRKVIFISFKNHVLQHRVPDQFLNYLNLYTPPP